MTDLLQKAMTEIEKLQFVKEMVHQEIAGRDTFHCSIRKLYS